jgi:hypothetical protein
MIPIIPIDARNKLNELLERRKKYFELSGFKRMLYQAEFEKIQKEIINLKLHFEIYHDELDLFSVFLKYDEFANKEKFIILTEAEEAGEVRWIRKKYNPNEFMAEYIGIVRKEIKDEWLKELYKIHILKRQGLIQCPWPIKLKDEED